MVERSRRFWSFVEDIKLLMDKILLGGSGFEAKLNRAGYRGRYVSGKSPNSRGRKGPAEAAG
jgi:hypothetical protein